METPLAKCERCGAGITSVTHRVNYGYCQRCRCGSSSAFYLPKNLRGPADTTAVAAELSRRKDWLLLYHWARVLVHLEPRDELLQFSCEEPYGLSFLISHGVLWRRAGELLSVITLDVEWESWRKIEEEDTRNLTQTRFATAEEIAACVPIREALHNDDRVVHYQHADVKHLPSCLPASAFEQHWDMLITEGRTGLMLIRNWECVLSVRLGHTWPYSIAIDRGWCVQSSSCSGFRPTL